MPILYLLMAHKAQANDTEEYQGTTPLFQACTRPKVNLDFVRALVLAGTNMAGQNFARRTLCTQLAVEASPEVLRFLFKLGVTPMTEALAGVFLCVFKS